MGNYTIFEGLENPRRGRQARNFTTNVPKILDLKSSSEEIFSKNRRWVPLKKERLGPVAFCDKGNIYKWRIGRGNYLNRRLRLPSRRTCIIRLQNLCFIS